MISTKKIGEWLEIIIAEQWQGLTIDELLRDRWKAPKKLIHQLRMQKEVLLNGESPNWNKGMGLGDLLQIKCFSEKEFGVTPSYYDIDILFEDEHLIIVNKPANMDTHPNESGQTNTLANAVAFHLQAKGEQRKVKHIHRLDKDTTGAVLFAKHELAGSILDRMLEERSIRRTYAALVSGILKKKKGTVNEPIGRDRHHPTRRRVSPSGQHAVTHFSVVRTYIQDKISLVKCSLDTGRTHQIRVHLSHIGHPLLGDSLYGGESTYNRQALHAVKLEFEHPFTLEQIVCHSPFIDSPPIFKNIDVFDF
ncbi:RluA family pseudouridine synthase [Cytobacillus sp. FJAT-54145]|uniref:Pseudouridine synthase n=1 Tax=Cytobacillus spartinae TaxID=3299023 RepID=A0ABW6KG07_9BACI